MLTKENVSYKILENHPADSRVKVSEGDVFQTLSSRMGTGGGATYHFSLNIPHRIVGAELLMMDKLISHYPQI